MERLTKRTEDGVVLIGDTVADMQAAAARALNRLAAYEDTKRTPEEAKSMASLFDYAVMEYNTLPETVKFFQRLRELAEAEKDGRVFVLPKTRARWIKDIIDERERQDVIFKAWRHNGCIGSFNSESVRFEVDGQEYILRLSKVGGVDEGAKLHVLPFVA